MNRDKPTDPPNLGMKWEWSEDRFKMLMITEGMAEWELDLLFSSNDFAQRGVWGQVQHLIHEELEPW